jgi:hypothetical protein
VILISNLTLNILESTTIASTEIYGTDKKTYINIGSGNVFNLQWSIPVFTNDTVDYYSLVIKRYDPTTNIYFNIFDSNVGEINHFAVNANMLPLAPEQYLLSIYVVAYGKYGSTATSNIVTPYVRRASGTYVKTDADYMKRALGFVYIPDEYASASRSAVEEFILIDSEGNTLIDENGAILTILSPIALFGLSTKSLISSDGLALFAKSATTLLKSTSNWELVKEGYAKSDNGEWHTNDIKYEALAASDGVVKVLVNGVYETLYIL